MALTYGPTAQNVRPRDASDVVVLTWDRQPATLAQPVVVDTDGRVSFTVAASNQYRVVTVAGGARSEDLVFLSAPAEPAGGGPVGSTSITDATALGRALLTAPDPDAARTALGAGTSSLELGGGSANASAGNHVHLNNHLLIINHGANAAAVRTPGAAAVLWIGTVRPNNLGPNDLYLGDA